MNRYCQWKISSPAGSTLQFSFPAFNTEGGWDFVNIYNGYSFAGTRALDMKAGSYSTFSVATYPGTNTAMLTYTTDYCCNPSAPMGFKFTVYYTPPVPPSPAPVIVPTAIYLSATTVKENSNANTIVATLTCSNTVNTVTYTTTSTLFSIPANADSLVTTASLTLNFEALPNSYVAGVLLLCQLELLSRRLSCRYCR